MHVAECLELVGRDFVFLPALLFIILGKEKKLFLVQVAETKVLLYEMIASEDAGSEVEDDESPSKVWILIFF